MFSRLPGVFLILSTEFGKLWKAIKAKQKQMTIVCRSVTQNNIQQYVEVVYRQWTLLVIIQNNY